MAPRQPFFPAHSVPWIATGGALAALCIAWIAQYGFNLAPCELCYWQRYGYYAAIAIGLVTIFQRGGSRARWIGLCLLTLALLVTAGIAIFHVGVEQKWWEGLTTCTGDFDPSMSAEELEQSIMNAPIVRCDEPAWTMFGISMAGYNAIYALLLAAFTARGAWRMWNR